MKVFWQQGGAAAACAVARERRGTWFDPALVDAAAELDLPDRILQVADVAEALSAERPYRAALAVEEVLSIMGRDAGPKLDAGAFAALEAWLPGRTGTLAAAA